MIYYTAFYPGHLGRIEAQTAQEEEALLALSAPERTAMSEGYAFTAWKGDTCLGVAGITEIWPGRAAAWALVSKHAGRHLPTLTKRVRRALDEHPAKRIEATVLYDFGPGHRWLLALGFRQETHRMEAYDPLGRDLSMYVRIK